MKILFICDTADAWKHGIWFHRIDTPTHALLQRGHAVKQVAMGMEFPEQMLEWPDTVVFGRTYPTHFNPIKWMKEYKKRGKRVIYDMDDDFWQVSKDNPSHLVSNAMKDQYEGMIKEADLITTPSKILAKKFKKHFKKPVMICNNCADETLYDKRKRQNDKLVIGYMGAASHWKDLQIIAEVISELSEKHDFIFKVYGLVGEPLEASMYSYRKILHSGLQPEKEPYLKAALGFYDALKDVQMWHVPFMPPELHPNVLGHCDFDIGIAPLEDTEFNKGKSCIKYYEYNQTGTVTLASDVEPYKSEVSYRAKNTKKDWKKKLEKLIVDEKFREKTLAEQTKFVSENRNMATTGLEWEKACQRPGGAPVLNQ